ncbi:TetR/AcrR family transcriptional regulator [Paenibacillus tengchongensis]|uniref:TetR/AcrR family transcriptional regulator n=1 Tax=Paenibacillus tengchongensis TaxID=2608684 RepID=UPI0016528CF9|nr:TetR/AcrR family transcriptional regulator [Paenibacillus tengchongensis]
MMPEEQTNRRTRRTRLALKTAFIELILEKDYDAVTILDIAERADYNRGTFYKHFIDKEDLLREIHDDFLLHISEALVQPYSGLQQVDAAMIAPSIHELFRHIETHKDVFLALLSVSREKLRADLLQTFRHSMQEDMHIEMKPGAPQLDYEIILSYQTSATVGVIMYWAESRFKYSADFMAGQLTLLVNTPIDHIVFKRRT